MGSTAMRSGIGEEGCGLDRGSQHTVVVALSGCNVQGCVPMVVDSMEVTAGIQEDLSNGGTAGEGGPVQADVLLLLRWEKNGLA